MRVELNSIRNFEKSFASQPFSYILASSYAFTSGRALFLHQYFRSQFRCVVTEVIVSSCAVTSGDIFLSRCRMRSFPVIRRCSHLFSYRVALQCQTSKRELIDNYGINHLMNVSV